MLPHNINFLMMLGLKEKRKCCYTCSDGRNSTRYNWNCHYHQRGIGSTMFLFGDTDSISCIPNITDQQ